jgi:nitroreductase
MDLYEALYTTRAMRRVRPDPIPAPSQARILDAAIRAPSGGNNQNWRFLLVDDPPIKQKLGPLYRESLAQLWDTVYRDLLAAARAAPDSPDGKQTLSIVRSAQYLADHFEQVPLYLFAFARHDRSGGSIFPAVWSAMLAARGEGIGSALTSVLGAFRGEETMSVLGVPPDEGWVNACCVSFGYPLGRWAVASRTPVDQVAFRNRWGEPLGLNIPDPLWPPGS